MSVIHSYLHKLVRSYVHSHSNLIPLILRSSNFLKAVKKVILPHCNHYSASMTINSMLIWIKFENIRENCIFVILIIWDFEPRFVSYNWNWIYLRYSHWFPRPHQPYVLWILSMITNNNFFIIYGFFPSALCLSFGTIYSITSHFGFFFNSPRVDNIRTFSSSFDWMTKLESGTTLYRRLCTLKPI